MKRAFLWLLSVCLVVSLCGCKEKTAITDYQYMYDGIVADWNKAASRDARRDNREGVCRGEQGGECRGSSEL